MRLLKLFGARFSLSLYREIPFRANPSIIILYQREDCTECPHILSSAQYESYYSDQQHQHDGYAYPHSA